MADKARIMQQLEEIVRERGGSKTPKKYRKELAELDPEFKNQYIDDGSLAYEKLRMAVLKDIAEKFDYEKPSQVPDYLLDKVMSGLAKEREIEIKKMEKKFKESEKMYSKLEEDKKALNYIKNVKALGMTEDDVYKLKYPELYREPLTDIMSKIKRDDIKVPPTKKDYVAFLDKITASGLVGGKKKRKASEYNTFVKNYFKKHKDATMKDAAAAWKKA